MIAIIAILVSLLLPAVNAAREAARRMQCINNLRQLGLAAECSREHASSLPIGRLGKEWTADPNLGTGKTQPGSWLFNVLPYMEEGSLYELMMGANAEARFSRMHWCKCINRKLADFFARLGAAPAFHSMECFPVISR